jgi:hypothetical protein
VRKIHWFRLSCPHLICSPLCHNTTVQTEKKSPMNWGWWTEDCVTETHWWASLWLGNGLLWFAFTSLLSRSLFAQCVMVPFHINKISSTTSSRAEGHFFIHNESSSIITFNHSWVTLSPMKVTTPLGSVPYLPHILHLAPRGHHIPLVGSTSHRFSWNLFPHTT